MTRLKCFHDAIFTKHELDKGQTQECLYSMLPCFIPTLFGKLLFSNNTVHVCLFPFFCSKHKLLEWGGGRGLASVMTRGIKHDFPLVIIRKVRSEELKTEGEARVFQHFTRDLANNNK